MSSPIQEMLERYKCKTAVDYRHALKEIIQEITLLGLYRAGFFRTAAFYGGTALRIFHGLDRFSEDLDFSLVDADGSFDLEAFVPSVRDELGAYGFELAVQSAFIKGGTLIHLLKIASLTPPVSGVPANEQVRIKFEVDTDPPQGATFEVKYQLLPVAYSVRLYDLPSLFAGKLHALLCRNWKTRVKGRDFYDYLWYLSRAVEINLVHLDARMRQSGHWQATNQMDGKDLTRLLIERFETVDFGQVVADVRPFVRDPRSLEIWSKDFFISITNDKLRTSGGTAQ